MITFSAKFTQRLLSEGKIIVDSVIARIRKEGGILRCYGCLQYGDFSARCDTPQERRWKRCFSCAEEGHIALDCEVKKPKFLRD